MRLSRRPDRRRARPGVEPELAGLPTPHPAARVDRDHDGGGHLVLVEVPGELVHQLLGARVRLVVDVAVLLVAEPLGVPRRRLEGGAVSPDRVIHEVVVLEELGANAEDNVVPAPRGLQDLVRHRQQADGSGELVPLYLRREEVHRRRADEAGDEQVDRLLVELRGEATCCSDPFFITATRSPSVIASVWSWVT